MEKISGETRKKSKSLVITFRIFQALFLGLFALGISMCIGDYSEFVKIPISNFSLTTTIFGGIGALITGILAKTCEKW